MPDPSTVQRLRGLVLDATELRRMTDWPPALIEDYLNILDNIILLADLIDIEIDQKIEEIPTQFTDGSVPFVDSGFLVEDNTGLNFEQISDKLTVGGNIDVGGNADISGDVKGKNRAKQYFFAGF